LLNNGTDISAIAAELATIGLTDYRARQEKSGSSDIVGFSTLLYGDTIVGLRVHFDGIDPQGATAFYHFDAGTSGLDVFGVPGTSYLGAALYRTGGAPLSLAAADAIPEPGTYALMFGGLGMMGLVARRRRRE